MAWSIWDIRLQKGKSEPSDPKGHGHLYLSNSDYVLNRAEISSLSGNNGGFAGSYQVVTAHPTVSLLFKWMIVCGFLACKGPAQVSRNSGRIPEAATAPGFVCWCKKHSLLSVADSTFCPRISFASFSFVMRSFLILIYALWGRKNQEKMPENSFRVT